MRMSLNTQIFFGALIGVLTGFYLTTLGVEAPFSQNTLFFAAILGNLFVNLLKMVLIPLVFTSITVGIANLKAHKQMQKVWKLSICYYLTTTALAVMIGLVSVNFFKPGVGIQVDMFQEAMGKVSLSSLTLSEFAANFLSSLFKNPVQAMAEGLILPTITFAIFLGIALVVSEGEHTTLTIKILNEFFKLVMIIVNWVMKLLPLGIMGLLCQLVAKQDPTIFLALLKFILVVIGTTLFHGFIALPLLLLLFTRTSPLTFYQGVKEALITAFSTSSSSATLPITLRCVEENLKVNKDIAGFILPLGATINMDGTALYEAIAALFIANIMGIELHIVQQGVVFAMAIIASLGAPGIPSAGMVTMIMVLQSVGLPAEAIAILYPIDRLLDSFRTMVNVEGDAIGSLIVNRWVHPNLKNNA